MNYQNHIINYLLKMKVLKLKINFEHDDNIIKLEFIDKIIQLYENNIFKISYGIIKN